MAAKQGSYQLQAPQSSTSPVKSLRLLAKAEPEDILALTLREERRTGNRSHPCGSQQIPSLLVRRLTINSRAVSQHVVSPLRYGRSQPGIRERAAKLVTLLLVFARELFVEGLRKIKQARRRAMLQRSRAAHICKVMEVADRRNPLPARSEIADAPACDAERLREPGDRNGAFRHSRQRGEADVPRPVEEKVLVDLIGKDEEVVLNRNIGNSLQFVEMEDLSRTVRRRIDDHSASTRSDRLARHIQVELPLRRNERDGNRLNPDRQERVEVVAVERLEDNHLIASIEQRETRSIQRPGRSGSHS